MMNKDRDVNEAQNRDFQRAENLAAGEAPDGQAGQPTFTPGPWKVRAATFCDDGIPSYEVVMPGRPTMNAVDARLISAAPELHNQLSQMIKRFEHCAIHAGSDPEMVGIATAEARAALDLSYKPDTNTAKPE